MSTSKVEYILSLKDLFSQQIKNADKETNKFDSSVNRVQSSLGGLAKAAISAFAIREAFQFGKGLLQTSMQVEGFRNQLNFASGSARQGAKDFQYINNLSETMGLDMLSAAEGFSKLEGATRGTILAGQQTKEIFEGVSMASTVMHLSTEQSNGAFLALSQIMSKGKLSAEELNGQLGERIPGAMGIAARAMNMTQGELMKLMQKGEVMSSEFLPRFAAQLKKEFAGGMEQATKSGQSNFNRMNNAILDMKLSLANTLMPVLSSVVKMIREGSSSVKEWVKENKGNLYNMMQFGSFLKETFIPVLKFAGVGLQIIFDVASKIAWAFKSIGTFGKVIISTLSTIVLFTWGYVKVVKALKIAEAEYNVVKAIGAALSGNWAGLAVAGAIAVAGATWLMIDAQKSYNKEKAKEPNAKRNLGQFTKGNNGLGKATTTPTAPTTPTTKSEASRVSQPQSTQIHINIGKLVETQNIKIENATKDFVEKLHNAIAEVLFNVVNDTNRIATQ